MRYRSGPLRTDALITIDGKISDTLDQRFPVYQSGQAWTSPPLELGYHTINVMVSTYAQPDERVVIDGFTVINNPSSTPPATLPTLPSTTTRTISYSYDGLLRLISADASDGDDYAYSYDLAGNRTGVWVNGVRTETNTYNSVNEVVGWTYDDAGNLLDDGTSTYAYDALNRQILQDSTAQVYNGDGVLVQSGRTVYAQDLALPLTQVLQVSDGTNRTNYIYGHERLMSDAGEWYATDALGSVRLTLDDNGTAYSGATFDPWGSPERGSVGTFGFTGELQQGDNVYLRARWYNANNGTFTSKDPFEGYPQQPYSLHPYQYAYSNPVLWTDPSGRCIPGFDTDCQFDLNIPSLENLCVSSWVPLIGQEDCKPIGNVDDFRETIIDPLVGAVKPTYDFVTNQPGAHETVGNGLEYIVQHPINSGIEVTKGLITPFVNIYQGLTCSDSKQLAHGLIGFGFLLGSARLIRNTPSVPEASAPQLILVTNPKANLPLGHNMVGVQIPGAVKPTIYHQQVGGLSASNGAIRNFISTIRGGQQTTIVTNSERV